jgi:hypothetical protein
MSVAPLKPRTVQTVTINTTHWVPNSNRYRFVFPTQIDLSRSRPALGVSQIALYNSIPNVSAALGNNTLTITWIDGVSKTFTLSDGYYDATGLNLFLQFAFAQSGWFLQSSSTASQAIYFAQIEANAINYALEVDFFVVPKTLPAGYSLPPNATWSLPTANAGRFCQITFCPGLLTLLGFSQSQATYPSSRIPTTDELGATATTLSFSSVTYPVLSPTFCIQLGCNLVSSGFQVNGGIFHQVPLSSSWGELISQTLGNQRLVKCVPARYQYIEISLYLQDGSPLVPLDPELVLTLMLEVDDDEGGY